MKNVSEGAERVANLLGRSLVEARHRDGCACGFCVKMRERQNGKKGSDAPDKKEPDEPTEPEKDGVAEALGEVKRSKGLAQGPAARRYSQMTSSQAAKPEWKPKAYQAAAAEVSGMAKSGQVHGFKNKGAGETTMGRNLPKKRVGEGQPSAVARQLVEALLG